MKRIASFICALLLFNTPVLFASKPSEQDPSWMTRPQSSYPARCTRADCAREPSSNFVASLSGGVLLATPGQQQTFFLTPTIEKTYTANKTFGTFPVGELFLGMQKSLSSLFQGQLGLVGGRAANATVSGQVWDDATSVFNNYAYRYHINRGYLGLKGKILADTGQGLIPWVSVSIAAGFNHSQSFTNTPLISEAVTMPNFAPHMEPALTYMLGVGVQQILTNHWQVGLGYEFSDWGKSRLNRAPDQTIGQGLSLNHLYTNACLLNITYLGW